MDLHDFRVAARFQQGIGGLGRVQLLPCLVQLPAQFRLRLIGQAVIQLTGGVEVPAVHPPLDDNPVLAVYQIETPVPVAHHQRVQQARVPVPRQLTQPSLPHRTLVRLAGNQQGGVDAAHFKGHAVVVIHLHSFLSHRCRIYLRRHGCR